MAELAQYSRLLRGTIDALGSRQRAAFLACCMARVAPLHERHHRLPLEVTPALRHARDLLLKYAGGTDVGADAIDADVDGLKSLLRTAEQTESQHIVEVVRSALHALRSMANDDPSLACKAALASVEAAGLADPAGEPVGKAEERDWQMNSVQRVREQPDTDIDASMLESFVTPEPEWLRRYESQ